MAGALALGECDPIVLWSMFISIVSVPLEVGISDMSVLSVELVVTEGSVLVMVSLLECSVGMEEEIVSSTIEISVAEGTTRVVMAVSVEMSMASEVMGTTTVSVTVEILSTTSMLLSPLAISPAMPIPSFTSASAMPARAGIASLLIDMLIYRRTRI